MTARIDWQPFVDGLRAFVRRRVPEADAEDVAQEVLLRLHRDADKLRDSARATGWVYGVARHAVADYYRARSSAPIGALPGSADQLPDPAPAGTRGFGTFAGEHDVHEEVLTWLRPTAETLSDGYREALLLADFEGRSQREVAEALGISLSGAKSRVQRARKQLKQRLERCCELALGPGGRVVDFRRREACNCGGNHP